MIARARVTDGHRDWVEFSLDSAADPLECFKVDFGTRVHTKYVAGRFSLDDFVDLWRAYAQSAEEDEEEYNSRARDSVLNGHAKWVGFGDGISLWPSTDDTPYVDVAHGDMVDALRSLASQFS